MPEISNSLSLVAQHKFRGYVQRVAFNLTLSEPMIRMLQIVRDYPPIDTVTAEEHCQLTDTRKYFSRDMFITSFKSLETRGLAYYNPAPDKNKPYPPGHIFYKLTRAGELTCDLLIEAGLMLPKKTIGFDNVAA